MAPKQQKRTRQDDTDSDSDYDIRKETGFWASWLMVESDDKDRPLSGLSPFAIAKGIKGLSGEPKTIKRLRDGSLLVQCACKLHSEMLQKSTVLIDRPIRVSPHRTLNSSRGVLRCRDLRGVSEGEIKAEMASQGVTDVRRVTFRKGTERLPTDTYFLTFCTTKLPEYVKVGYLRVRVTLYVPSPLRCFKCQKFGHVRDRCPGEEVCGTCSKAVHTGECVSPALCVNCGGDHPSSSRDCPQYVTEKEIQRVKTEQKLSFFEAKKLVAEAQPKNGSYADATKRKLMKEKAIQTEIHFDCKLSTVIKKPVPNASTTTVGTQSEVQEKEKVKINPGTSGAGPAAAPSQRDERSRSSARGQSGERPSSLPPKPVSDRRSAGPQGSRKVEVIEVTSKKKVSAAGRGAGSGDRPKKGDKNFNRFVLTDGCGEQEME